MSIIEYVVYVIKSGCLCYAALEKLCLPEML